MHVSRFRQGGLEAAGWPDGVHALGWMPGRHAPLTNGPHLAVSLAHPHAHPDPKLPPTPVALQGNICKHTLFVLLRVLNMSPEDPLVWQKALLSSEVDEVGAGSPLAPHWFQDKRWSWRA